MDCQDAVIRLIHYGDKIEEARILSSDRVHCLLLANGIGDLTAIKSGFGSGYGGEGPAAFSYVLQLLRTHGAKIEEFEVGADVVERLDNSALTILDIERIDAARPVRPTRWRKYILDDDRYSDTRGRLWREFRPVIPYSIIDYRIIDLVIVFWQDPDAALFKGIGAWRTSFERRRA